MTRIGEFDPQLAYAGPAGATAQIDAGPSIAEARSGLQTATVVAGGVALTLLGGAAATFINNSNNHPGSGVGPEAASAATNSGEACADFVASDAGTNNPVRFNSGSFLPRAAITSPDSAKNYIGALFAQGGTVAGGSPDTLAALMATSVIPGTREDANDPNYNYIAAFNDRIAAYSTAQGQEAAQADCKEAYDFVTQVAEYTDDWAQPGEPVSEFRATRSKNYEINGAELTKPQVATKVFKGIELKLRSTTKEVNGQDLQGFPSVLITEEGQIFVKGLKPAQSGQSHKHRGIAGKTASNNTQGGGNKLSQNRGNNGTSTGGGSNQGNRQGSNGHNNGGGGGNQRGNSPENQTGSNQGPHPSHQGPENTPNSGTPTTPTRTETTPPTTTTAPPPKTETTPPTTTTTTPPPPPPTTTTTTTTGDKGSGGECVPVPGYTTC